jgi:transposase-like protein
MQYPECKSTHIRKNGLNKRKQNYICADCARQFLTDYHPHKSYSDEFKRECLLMYVNCMSLRAIERAVVLPNA